MKGKTVLYIVLATAAVIILASAAGTYNSFVNMEENISGKESQVKNRLQQRHDKMIQVVAAVEGLETHAEDIYGMITDARAQYSGASSVSELAEADAAEAAALTSLLVVVEQNPNINASGAYFAYIDEVSGMENALAVARRDYNEAVQSFNAKVRRFPAVLFANLFGFRGNRSYWKINDGADEIPLIDFED